MNKDRSGSAETNLRIPWAKPVFWGHEVEYVQRAITSTWISGGEYIERLEREFAGLCGTHNALSVCNGTAALHIAYLTIGLKHSDEVIVPGFGFLAAANIALHMGARPVFADVDGDTWCVTAESIERCLSAKTSAIIPIHTYGNVCAMDDILSLAQKHHIPVIEDAAEAFPSRYKSQLAGTMGEIGCFSFQATKTITTGEGGMVVTADRNLYDTMTLYRSHGMRRKRHYWHELPGHNFRLTNIQAALGCAQLVKLDVIVRERHRVYSRYRAAFSELLGATFQAFTPCAAPVIWAVALRLDPDAFPQGRDAVMMQMEEAGIETRPGFYAASMMDFYHAPPLPMCEELSRQVISLPSYPTLEDEQIEFICQRLESLRR